MSFEPDSVEHQRDIEGILEEINLTLKAILMGIEMIADQDNGSLILDAAEED